VVADDDAADGGAAEGGEGRNISAGPVPDSMFQCGSRRCAGRRRAV